MEIKSMLCFYNDVYYDAVMCINYRNNDPIKIYISNALKNKLSGLCPELMQD